MIYGGDQFAKLYELMNSATGTWWNRDGKFTFEQFVGLLLMHEGAGNYLFSMLDAFAGAQQLYVGGGGGGAYGPYCPSGPCQNGVFNYFAAFSQSARGLVDTYVKGGTDIRAYTGYGGRGPGQTTRVMKEADEYGSAMLHPKHQEFTTTTQPISHVTWDLDRNRNSGLSNYGFGYKNLVDTLIANGLDPYTYYPGGNQGIYYFTDGQYGNKYAVWLSVDGARIWNP
jgi:hypothetical protein